MQQTPTERSGTTLGTRQWQTNRGQWQTKGWIQIVKTWKWKEVEVYYKVATLRHTCWFEQGTCPSEHRTQPSSPWWSTSGWSTRSPPNPSRGRVNNTALTLHQTAAKKLLWTLGRGIANKIPRHSALDRAIITGEKQTNCSVFIKK